MSASLTMRTIDLGVIETMADAMLERGVPEHIRSDNGAEMTAKIVRSWLAKLGTKTLYIEPGSPWENGYCESFNGKLRDECLNGESHRRHRAMAQSIQHDPTALILEQSAASTPNIHSPIAPPGSQLPDAIVSIPLVQNIRQVMTLIATADRCRNRSIESEVDYEAPRVRI